MIANETIVSSAVAIKLKTAIRTTSRMPQGGSSDGKVGEGSGASTPNGGTGSKGELGVRDTEWLS